MSKPKTPAERQQDLRDRRESAGLLRKEFWLTSEEIRRVREFLNKIRKKGQEETRNEQEMNIDYLETVRDESVAYVSWFSVNGEYYGVVFRENVPPQLADVEMNIIATALDNNELLSWLVDEVEIRRSKGELF